MARSRLRHRHPPPREGEVQAIGLWRLILDPATDELLDASYHGNFDLEESEITAYLCARLGPPQAG
jgi:hypothetical protein